MRIFIAFLIASQFCISGTEVTTTANSRTASSAWGVSFLTVLDINIPREARWCAFAVSGWLVEWFADSGAGT